jgi:hypothetical protein
MDIIPSEPRRAREEAAKEVDNALPSRSEAAEPFFGRRLLFEIWHDTAREAPWNRKLTLRLLRGVGLKDFALQSSDIIVLGHLDFC